MEYSDEQIWTDIQEKDELLTKACRQVIILNGQIEQLRLRYKRATKDKMVSFRSSLRIKMDSLTYVRNIMFEYCSVKNEELQDLRRAAKIMEGQHSDSQ